MSEHTHEISSCCPTPTDPYFADTECLEGSHGNIETYLTEDVPAFVVDRFDPSDDPERWTIGGASMGVTTRSRSPRSLTRSFPWLTMRLGLASDARSVEAQCGGRD